MQSYMCPNCGTQYSKITEKGRCSTCGQELLPKDLAEEKMLRNSIAQDVHSIKNMATFFVILTVINLIISIIGAISIASIF